MEESRNALETKDSMPTKVVESTQNINKITQSQYKRVSMACCSFDDWRLFVSNFDGWRLITVNDLINAHFQINASHLTNASLYTLKIVLDAPV